MTIFDQFRRENSNFSPLKIVNFDTKIKIDHFSSCSRICIFWTKNGPLTQCVQVSGDFLIDFNFSLQFPLEMWVNLPLMPFWPQQRPNS